MVFFAKILFVSTLVVIFVANNVVAVRELILFIKPQISNYKNFKGPGALALIELGKQVGAPFAETAVSRLHGNIFGAGRATRSTDILIFNKSGKGFKLSANDCEYGG